MALGAFYATDYALQPLFTATRNARPRFGSRQFGRRLGDGERDHRRALVGNGHASSGDQAAQRLGTGKAPLERDRAATGDGVIGEDHLHAGLPTELVQRRRHILRRDVEGDSAIARGTGGRRGEDQG